MITLDAAAGEHAKRIGMARAAATRSEVLRAAQDIAVVIALGRGRVNIDDVRAELENEGWPDILGNAAGSVFRGAKWMRIGSMKSKRVSNHRRWVSIWGLK